MKLAVLIILGLISFAAMASDVNHFNKILIQDVQHAINTDNDQAFKKKTAPMRAPASSENVQEDVKFEKRNVRQTGMEKW